MVGNFGTGETVTSPANGVRRTARVFHGVAAGGVGLALVVVLSAGAVLGARHSGLTTGSHTHMHAVAASHARSQSAAGASPAATAAPTTRGAAPAATLYLVASQAQADAAQAGLDAATVIGTPLSGTTSSARVVVVTSPTDAAAWQSKLADENTLRASLGLAEVELVDLR